MFNLFKAINKFQPELREFDPTTVQRIKEGAYLTKLIIEIQRKKITSNSQLPLPLQVKVKPVNDDLNRLTMTWSLYLFTLMQLGGTP